MKLEIIAHRGASHDAPENTLAAFTLGWKQQADAVELDIRLTADGKIIAIHDANTKRTTGVTAIVARCTLAELRALDAGRWKGPQWQGEKLPTLAEALASVPAGKRLFIELKAGPEILPELARDLNAAVTTPEQTVLIGFDYATMQQAKKCFPNRPVYLLADSNIKQQTRKRPAIEKLIEQAKAANLDGLDLSARFPIDAAFVAQVHAAALGLAVWTVDRVARAAKLAAAGLDALTTNRPGWLREQLHKS